MNAFNYSSCEKIILSLLETYQERTSSNNLQFGFFK